MCIRDRNTSTYSPPEDGSRQPTRFSEASRRELAETENLLRVETQHAAPDEAGVCALFRYKGFRIGQISTIEVCLTSTNAVLLRERFELMDDNGSLDAFRLP